MTASRLNPKAEAFFNEAGPWQAELKKLRKILLGCKLTEEVKWGKPCYTFQASNLAILIPLKEHCALMFAKGALLKDPQGLLIQPTENTQSGRWIKFSSVREITRDEASVKALISEAMAAEKAGLKVVYKKTSDYAIPEELKKQLAEDPAFKTAFESLTPGRQRGYLLYFSAAKQAKTREARIAKYRRQIFSGKGLSD